MNKTELNILNLISLWKNASLPFRTYNETESIGFCFIPGSQWPNRIWQKNELNSEVLNEIKWLLKTKKRQLTFSYFDVEPSNNNITFDDHDLNEISIQYGMGLNLAKKFKVSKPLKFHLVTDSFSSKIWSQSFQNAFGYLISEETINKTFEKINYYIIYDQEDLVGTVISHQTQSTIGIHSLGIIPNMRGKEYATQIMYHLLNKGLEQDCKLATLQASKMAKSIYEKMGFTTEFIMRNYQLKTQ